MQPARTSLRTLGVFWIVYCGLLVLGIAWMLLNENVLTLMWGALLNRVPDPLAWMSYFHLFFIILVIFDAVAAIFSLIAGLSLLAGSPAARRLALTASVFGILTSAPGAVMGIFTVAAFVPRVGIGEPI